MTEQRTARGDYRHHRAFATRWNDNDAYGHLNNTVYYEAMDTTITSWLVEHGDAGLLAGTAMAVCAASSCEFRASAGFPEALEVGLRAGRIGTSSIAWDLGIFRESDGELLAEGRFVHVFVDPSGLRPVPVPGALRAQVEADLLTT